MKKGRKGEEEKNKIEINVRRKEGGDKSVRAERW